MAHCVTLVQLSVSCDHLIDKDIGSKSDPLCVLLQDVEATGLRWVRTMGLTVRGMLGLCGGGKVRGLSWAYWLLHSLAGLFVHATARALSSPRLCSLKTT